MIRTFKFLGVEVGGERIIQGMNPACDKCKQERVPLFEGRCLACFTPAQKVRWDELLRRAEMWRTIGGRERFEQEEY